MTQVSLVNQGAEKNPAASSKMERHIAMRRGARRVLDKTKANDLLLDQLESIKARIRAKVEHPFRLVKCQFGFTKVRYRGLMKDTAALATLAGLTERWMVRRRFLALAAEVRP